MTSMPRDQPPQVAGLVRQDIEPGAELRALGSSLVENVLASQGSDPLDESVRLFIVHAPLVRRQELVLPSANVDSKACAGPPATWRAGRPFTQLAAIEQASSRH